MKSKIYVGIVLVIVILVVAGWFWFSKDTGEAIADDSMKVTVYKSPSCGCCVNYIALLRGEGYDVEVIETEDMTKIKQQYGVPREMESCHTSIFGDYVVEGHMPFEVITKMLEEQPDIKGIALPNMPAGSPGMPGAKREPFTVYTLNDNSTSIYLIY
ncbi:MAG: DUF411 domain-containing protein [Candidatus Komeilibacteria bacterium]